MQSLRRNHEESATLGADCRCLKDMVGNVQFRVEEVKRRIKAGKEEMVRAQVNEKRIKEDIDVIKKKKFQEDDAKRREEVIRLVFPTDWKSLSGLRLKYDKMSPPPSSWGSLKTPVPGGPTSMAEMRQGQSGLKGKLASSFLPAGK